MKKLAVLIVVLCICIAACKDTAPKNVWRTTEARLTEAPWRRCATPECGREGPIARDPCPELIETHAVAVATLANQRQCTDRAIDALQRFRTSDARALSDLAAAYHVRAEREQRASDLLRALEWAERAVAALPRDPAARFNLALAQESLGLSGEAIRSWETFLTVDTTSEWAQEARERLRRLRAPDAASQWPRVRAQLSVALKQRNRTAVRELIARFPTPGLEYFEREVLAEGEVEAAKLLASELSLRLGGGRYFPDVAEAMERAREGHAAFREVRFADAARLLREAGSPFFMTAELEQAMALDYEKEVSGFALSLLEPLEEEARKRRYTHFVARIQATRGYVLWRSGSYLESLESNEAALKTFSRLGDLETVASVHRTQSGTSRTLGQLERAWREALQATRHLSRVSNVRRKNVMLGEVASSAAALGFPRIAVLYEDAAVEMIRKQITATEPERLDRLAFLRRMLSIALRARAGFEIEAGSPEAATSDINEAVRLAEATPKYTSVIGAFRAGVHEVQGRSTLAMSPGRAIESFTKALDIIPQGEMRTFRAALYAQRAEAARRANRDSDSERDLENAIRELRAEESHLLEQRERGEGEEHWRTYFSRFHETHERLIRHFADRGEHEKAFNTDERSRAFEPLNLILRMGVAPPSFRKLVPRGEPMPLAAIQRALPRGTVLLQYRVLGDRTLTWILSRDVALYVRQRAKRRDVERWSETLQSAARRRDLSTFERTLRPAYEELFAEPLRLMEAAGQRAVRLVIVPDGAMYGLPFAALYDSESRQHLIERFPIEIAGSATLYVFSLQRDAALQSSTPPSVLLVGNPRFGDQDLARGLKPLPRAEIEVEQIRDLWTPHARLLTGAEATIPRFLEEVRGKTIIHIAAHSIVSPDEPWRSVLLLARSDGRSGAMDVKELLETLTLDQTRLFVLSACSSAGGFPVGPEGLAPLVRPLLTAGVPAVMGTLWDVEDATAERVSVSFHRHYGQGRDAATALQAAQLELLRNGSRGRQVVLVWAPFQVIGHASSPSESTIERLNGGQLGIHRKDSLHRDDGIHPGQ